MNAIPFLDASSILRQHGLRPIKRLGQNFLQEPALLETIVRTAEIEPSDSVLEIGAGLGHLTRYLAAAAQRVIAVEYDERLAKIAAGILGPHGNVRIVCADILSISPAELGLTPHYLVVANIPYNITSAIIRHLLEAGVKPRRIVLTVQKEVAERICAQPPRMSVLSLSVQVYGSPRIEARIPASAFFPSPQVDSAVVRIEIYDEPRIKAPMLPVFFALVRSAFSQKRKKLRNNLAAGVRMDPGHAQGLIQAAGVDPNLRAEALTFEDWQMLCDSPYLAAAVNDRKTGQSASAQAD